MLAFFALMCATKTQNLGFKPLPYTDGGSALLLPPMG